MSSLTELTALLPSHPHLLTILQTNRPLATPSSIPHSDLVKFLNKLSSHVLSKDTSVDGLKHRRAAWRIARQVVEQDREGWVLTNGWGKTWVHAMMALVSPSLPETQLVDLLPLLTLLLKRSLAFPAFSREVALPVVPKCSQALVACMVDAEGKGEWGVVALVLDYLPVLFPLSPTPHRPLVPTLLPLLHRILLTAPAFPIPSILSDKPTTLVQRAALVLAHLHILAGKVAASAAFHTDMLLALTESHACLSALIDGTLALPPHHGAQVQGVGVTFIQTVDTRTRQDVLLGVLAREVASEEKIQPFLRAMEGWTAVIHALLAFPTARPVTLPLGGILHLAMRMLTCTPDVPLLEHVQGDTELAAGISAALPRLWIAGIKLVSACVIATGSHVVPYLGLILDHTIHLAELVALGQALTPQLALIRFHTLILARLDPNPSSSAYHTRLVKLCIGHVTPLMQQKPVVQAEDAGLAGKKGKKRMRGAGDDAFVGSLAGRVGQGMVSKDEGRVVIAALKLLSVLLPHPALPPALQALAIRLVLSASYSLETQSAAAVSADLTLHEKISRAVDAVLSKAVKLRGGSGSLGPWAGLMLDRTASNDLSDAIASVIHPLLPPLSRPLPPISSLVFYNIPSTDFESSEEKKLRAEMGIMTEQEMTSGQEEEARKRLRVEEPEVPTSVTSTVTVVTQSTATAVVPAASAVTSSAATSPPEKSVDEPSHAAQVPAPFGQRQASDPIAEQDKPESHIGHGSLSVQAVPPPVVLPPDPTTASVHLAVAGPSAVDAVEDDDFEMPEINLESDTDEDEEE
ncbi:hypothetical protein QFC20_000301 [Naganishia adeliensis]|uniref:Uncharacterized protein n=1 Tax=Naganishia adeliensis TaxID=92952 RepID=A0ACC2WZG3_9TREE|nr:hypothetical protein QFC20_000301 [Naganishia adeliensis]